MCIRDRVNTVSYPNKAFKLPKKTYIEEFPNDNDTQTIFDYVFCGNYQPCLLYTSNSLYQKHNVSIRGGSEETTYYVSANYTQQGGRLPGNDKRRMSLRMNRCV